MRRLIPFMFTLTSVLVVALLLGGALGGCGSEWTPPRDLTAQEKNLVQASNSFGFKIFNEVVTQSDGGNIFISPLSISMALGMTYNGARGSTEQGMRECLEFGDLSTEEINAGYRDLIELLCGMDPSVSMEIANSIWYRQGYEVLQDFIDINMAFFAAVVTELDFSDSGAADTINAWVSEKTHGKIEEIVDSPIPPDMIMYLINAVYFKGNWVTQFDKSDTSDDTFHAPDGDKTVKMMYLKADLSVLRTDELQAVNLPYGHGLFSMTIIVPAEDQDIDELIASLGGGQFENLLGQFELREEMRLYMPRYELEYEKTLNDVLIALGMQDAFSEEVADFTGINPSGELFISEVKHKTYVKVNEEGTEAAAVTSVAVAASAAPDEIRVDRPFIFVIHDSHSRALIFMGKIVDPPSE